MSANEKINIRRNHCSRVKIKKSERLKKNFRPCHMVTEIVEYERDSNTSLNQTTGNNHPELEERIGELEIRGRTEHC